MAASTTIEKHILDQRADQWCDRCRTWSASVARVALHDRTTLEWHTTIELLVCQVCGYNEVTR